MSILEVEKYNFYEKSAMQGRKLPRKYCFISGELQANNIPFASLKVVLSIPTKEPWLTRL